MRNVISVFELELSRRSVSLPHAAGATKAYGTGAELYTKSLEEIGHRASQRRRYILSAGIPEAQAFAERGTTSERTSTAKRPCGHYRPAIAFLAFAFLFLFSASTHAQTLTPCGLKDDGQLHTATNYNTLTPGALGNTTVDPDFGCQFTRVTDGKDLCNGAAEHYYSLVSPINLDDSMIIEQVTPPECGSAAPRYIASTAGATVVSVANFPNTATTANIPWDNFNTLVFYYVSGVKLFSGTVNKAMGTVSSSVICDFTGTYNTLSIPDDEDISLDGNHLVLAANTNTTSGVAVFVTLTPASPAVHTGCMVTATLAIGQQVVGGTGWHKIQQTAENYAAILITTDKTTKFYDTTGTLVRSDANTNHWAFGFDSDGVTSVAIGHIRTGSSLNLCPSQFGFNVMRVSDGTILRCLLDAPKGNTDNVSHVSYADGFSAGPFWVLLSIERSIPSGQSTSCNSTTNQGSDMSCLGGNSNWFVYSGEEIYCKIDASACFRLLHHRSRSSVTPMGIPAYWSTPRGVITKDGTGIVFDSEFNDFNLGSTTAAGFNYTDSYFATILTSSSGGGGGGGGNPAPPVLVKATIVKNLLARNLAASFAMGILMFLVLDFRREK